jgi:predicted Zn-dependent protease
MFWVNPQITVVFLLVVLAAPSLGSAKEKKEEKREVGKGVNFYSIEKEIALGRQLAQEIEREAKIIGDPLTTEYVNRVGQNLAKNSDTAVPISVKVIDSEEINAFALPGGFLFVNTGLILKAETEAELAGVMAHEIAHVAARHATRQMSRANMINVASLPLIFIGGWAGYGVRQAAGLAVPMTFLKFSRGFENEADRLALDYVYKSGYDPPALIDFLEKLDALERRKPGAMSQLFRSHPPIASRIAETQKDIQDLLSRQPQYVVSTSEFDEVRKNLKAQLSRRKVDTKPNAPTLRRSPTDRPDKIESRDVPDSNDDERPTLKRTPSPQ